MFFIMYNQFIDHLDIFYEKRKETLVVVVVVLRQCKKRTC